MKPRWLAGYVVTALLAACGPTLASSTPSATPSPAASSASASPSATTTAAPSASPTETPGPTGFAADSLIEIIADLVVRSDPGVDPPSTMYPAGLGPSDRAFVVDGPVEASGYPWYLVAPLERGDGSRGPFGWIAAASREGEAWVRSIAAPCPTTPDLAGVVALQPLERLACFGDDSLTLTAPSVSCGAGGGPWVWDPSWLMELGGCAMAIDASAPDALLMRQPPGGTGHDGSTPATVSGHFDDPAAAGCTVNTSDPAYPAPGPEEAVVMCRTQFVVEP